MSHYLELDDFELEYLRIRLQLRKLKEEAYANMSLLQNVRIYLYYSLLRDTIDCYKSFGASVVDTDIYFPTVESAENAILLIGEDRLKKYYFCIEEKDGTNNDENI